ncbi:MAG: regulatory protein MarR [Gemmatimonadetes bacterium]|nr:regulatory protein MarR [Gemmatimonadota bacterium]
MDRAQRVFVDRMGQAGEMDGMSPIAGRLFAVLLLSDEPRSLDELAELMGVSKASVSTDARRLLERGTVERVTRPGDRRDYYELAPDFFAQVIRSRVARWRRIQQLVGTVRESPSDLSPKIRDRFDSIDEIHSFVVDRVDAALTAWERRARKATAKTHSRRRRSA